MGDNTDYEAVAEETAPDTQESKIINETDDEASVEISADENIQALLEDARAKADEHWDEVLRTRAEMDNLKKRTTRDIENAHKFGLERLMSEILPVSDSMGLGIQAASADDVDITKVREGMEMTYKMLTTALEKFGLTEVNPQGEKFDHEKHQAMSMLESPDAESGTVIEVFQKGYLLNDRLIRPAMVVVAK